MQFLVCTLNYGLCTVKKKRYFTLKYLLKFELDFGYIGFRISENRESEIMSYFNIFFNKPYVLGAKIDVSIFVLGA